MGGSNSNAVPDDRIFALINFKSGATKYNSFPSDRQRGFVPPAVLHRGGPLSITDAMALLAEYGFHGATEPVEGAVWRVERNELIEPGKGGARRRVVDFLAKFVRPDKVDGTYLPGQTGGDVVWNTQNFGSWITGSGY